MYIKKTGFCSWNLGPKNSFLFWYPIRPYPLYISPAKFLTFFSCMGDLCQIMAAFSRVWQWWLLLAGNILPGTSVHYPSVTYRSQREIKFLNNTQRHQPVLWTPCHLFYRANNIMSSTFFLHSVNWTKTDPKTQKRIIDSVFVELCECYFSMSLIILC